MQTRFTDYLISLRTDKSGQYLKTIQGSVAAVFEEKEPELGKLGGIFKGFPRQYENVSAIPQNTWKQYYGACAHLISIGHFGLKPDADLQKSISNLVESILTFCMQELFDAKGRFKDDVIELLDLQKILNVYKDQPKNLLLIKQQILYAYFSEIVLTNLTIEFHEQQHSGENKVRQLALTRSMQKTVANSGAEFTDFFQRITTKKLCQSAALEEEMAVAIQNIPVNRMIDITMADLEKNPQAKIFWQEVLYCLQQDANNYLYVKSLYSLLGEEGQVATESYLAKYKENAGEEQIPQVEDKEEAVQCVNHLISARDNAALLQQLINAVRQLPAVDANRNFLDAVTKVQRDFEFLKEKTTANLLLSVAAVARSLQCGNEIFDIVEKFRKRVQSPASVSTMFPPAQQRRDSMSSSSSSFVSKRPQS